MNWAKESGSQTNTENEERRERLKEKEKKTKKKKRGGERGEKVCTCPSLWPRCAPDKLASALGEAKMDP